MFADSNICWFRFFLYHFVFYFCKKKLGFTLLKICKHFFIKWSSVECLLGQARKHISCKYLLVSVISKCILYFLETCIFFSVQCNLVEDIVNMLCTFLFLVVYFPYITLVIWYYPVMKIVDPIYVPASLLFFCTDLIIFISS